MYFSPGLLYLLRLLPGLLATSVATYLCFQIASHHLDLYIPGWVVTLCCLSSQPLLRFASKALKPFFDARAAASQGARLAPRVGGSPTHVVTSLSRAIKDGYPGQAFSEFSQEGGNTFTLGLPSQDMLVTFEPEHIKAILATQFKSFEKGPVFFEQMKSLLGVGIFNSDGDMWKFHRGITRPFFTKERINDFDTYDRNCTTALNLARSRLGQGYPIDFQDLVGRFTLDSATQFLCGQDVGSLSTGIPYPSYAAQKNDSSFFQHPANRFLEAFAEGQAQASARRALGEDWPLLEMWNDHVVPLRKVVDNFTKPILEQALVKKRAEVKEGPEGSEGECLLEHLIDQTQDPNVLKDEIMNMLVAGRDTTASLISFSFYMLCEHPEIEAKLREEIFEKVGATERPTYEQIHDMRYTRAFLNEVLRLYPPVPMNNRTTNQAVVLPSKTGLPIYVPAGTNVVYSVMYMQRRTDLWGPDALEFDPMRFLDERARQYLTHNPFIFSPFNAGPRICLGQQFAYHEATFFLIRLLQNFTGFELETKENVAPDPEWKNSNDRRATDKIRPTSHLTMCIKGGLWVRMKPFESSESDP